MYESYKFIAILGLSGAGKTDVIHKYRALGEQVFSVEEILNIRGICIKNLCNDISAEQDNFDNLIEKEFLKFDKNRFIYIEWKPVEIVGIKLPDELVDRVRSHGCFVLPKPRRERLVNLVEFYGEWKDHMDIIIDGIAERMNKNDVDILKSFQKSEDENRVLGFVECLLSQFLDPLYIDEIMKFNGAYFGDFAFEASVDRFLGSFFPSPTHYEVVSHVI